MGPKALVSYNNKSFQNNDAAVREGLVLDRSGTMASSDLFSRQG
jgi:hypothetical protein